MRTTAPGISFCSIAACSTLSTTEKWLPETTGAVEGACCAQKEGGTSSARDTNQRQDTQEKTAKHHASNRGENDSDSTQGGVPRQGMYLKGYARTAMAAWLQSENAHICRKRLRGTGQTLPSCLRTAPTGRARASVSRSVGCSVDGRRTPGAQGSGAVYLRSRVARGCSQHNVRPCVRNQSGRHHGHGDAAL